MDLRQDHPHDLWPRRGKRCGCRRRNMQHFAKTSCAPCSQSSTGGFASRTLRCPHRRRSRTQVFFPVDEQDRLRSEPARKPCKSLPPEAQNGCCRGRIQRGRWTCQGPQHVTLTSALFSKSVCVGRAVADGSTLMSDGSSRAKQACERTSSPRRSLSRISFSLRWSTPKPPFREDANSGVPRHVW